MKRMLFTYVSLLLAAGGVAAIDSKWGGFALLMIMMVWFVHAVFASTGERERS